MEFEKPHDALPREIMAADPGAKVTSQITKQGVEPALETLIETKRGPLQVTIIERRFRGRKRQLRSEIQP